MTPTTDDQARDDAPALRGYDLFEELDRRPELGTTYRAYDGRRDVPVEVTLIAAVLAGDARYRDRLARRRRLLAGLRHPALVPELDGGKLGDALFVVADPMPGPSLRTLLESGPLSPSRALAILAPVADLLDRLQAARLPAGDVSSWTIAVDEADRGSVTRLGLAGVSLLTSMRLEVSADALAYSATEQLRGLAAGPRTDVFGLAAVLFEAVTGELPFGSPAASAGTDLTLRSALARRARPAPSASAWRPGVGTDFDAVLKAALSELPRSRPASAGELVERLGRALAETGSGQLSRDSHMNPRRPPLEGSGTVVARTSRHLKAPSVTRAPGDHPAPADADGARALTHGPHAEPPRASGRRARLRHVKSRPRLQGTGATAPAAAVALLAGTMLAVGDAPAPRAEAPHALQVAAGALRITYPSTWQPEPQPARVADLALGAPLALVPRPGFEAQPDSRLLAGIVGETGPSLLAPDLERRLGDKVKPETVLLGTHEAYRYRNVALSGQKVSSTIYTIPTTAGVATIACFSPEFVDTLKGQCEAMATTLRLSGPRALPLGPNAAYARRVSDIVARADVARRRGRAQLRLAKRAPGQGRRASDLAAVFRRSAARLASGGPEAGTAPVHRDLIGALRAVGDGYKALATAAADHDRRRFDAARRVVSAREAGLTRTLERMRRLGYRLR